MASLALMVMVIFFSIILSGPICLILSNIKIIPNIIVYLFSFATILAGIWFFMLPITIVRYIGLIAVWLAIVSIIKRMDKKK